MVFNISIVSVIFASFKSPSLPIKDKMISNICDHVTRHPQVCARVECPPVVQEPGAARPLWPEPPRAWGKSSVRAGASVKTKLSHDVREPGLLESVTQTRKWLSGEIRLDTVYGTVSRLSTASLPPPCWRLPHTWSSPCKCPQGWLCHPEHFYKRQIL